MDEPTDKEALILDALETAQLMFESIQGLDIRYSPTDVRPGHFLREINLLRAARAALGGVCDG